MEENRTPRKVFQANVLAWITALSSLVLAVVGVFALRIAQRQIAEMRDESSIQH
jgi:hypothetical protein